VINNPSREQKTQAPARYSTALRGGSLYLPSGAITGQQNSIPPISRLIGCRKVDIPISPKLRTPVIAIDIELKIAGTCHIHIVPIPMIQAKNGRLKRQTDIAVAIFSHLGMDGRPRTNRGAITSSIAVWWIICCTNIFFAPKTSAGSNIDAVNASIPESKKIERI
jgi:hypothetical protein